MEKFCSPHLRRVAKKVPATHEVDGEPFCEDCYTGKSISEGESCGQAPDERKVSGAQALGWEIGKHYRGKRYRRPAKPRRYRAWKRRRTVCQRVETR
jgi:hypothetical protein